MNSSTSGWSTSSTTIFAARRVLPPDLIVPAEASAPRMKETGPEAKPPFDSCSFDERRWERLTPARDPVEDRLHRVVDREDEAGRALRRGLEADVEPDRAVEGGVLVDEDRLQLGLEGVGFVGVREVAALLAPGDGGVDDAADHLLHAGLALRRGEAAAEVLLRDDVRRGLRPELRELDAALLEGGAVAARDDRVARLPLDLVERVAAGNREEALHAETGPLLDDRVNDLLGRRFAALNLLDACHLPSRNFSRRPLFDRAAGRRILRRGTGP